MESQQVGLEFEPVADSIKEPDVEPVAELGPVIVFLEPSGGTKPSNPGGAGFLRA